MNETCPRCQGMEGAQLNVEAFASRYWTETERRTILGSIHVTSFWSKTIALGGEHRFPCLHGILPTHMINQGQECSCLNYGYDS